MGPNSPSMKQHSSGGWKSAIFIIFVEVAERFAFSGVGGNLFVYLTKVLGQPTATAAKNVNTWQGTSAIFAVIGGFLADSYLGRFNTILISSITYLLGLILLTVAVSVVPLHLRAGVFFVALYIVSVGEGGHKPCVQTFAADQFDENTPHEKAAKSSFFNWWYVGIISGATAAFLVVIYVEEHVGWGVGFGMLAAAVAAALAVFFVGRGGYRRQAPTGSPFTGVVQVVIAAVRKRRLSEAAARGVCEDGYKMVACFGDSNVQQVLPRTSQMRFLDKAAMIDEKDDTIEKRNPWRLCSVTQVEEAKLVFQLIPIWFSCLMFSIVHAQLSTFFTKQGTTMNRSITPHFQIPAASFQVLSSLTIITSILLYQRGLVPFARRLTGRPAGITILQRIGTGLAISALTMVVAACVETRRVQVAKENGLLNNPRSVVPMLAWWLIPQYVLLGVSDMFTVVGLQELFYDQMPDGMRSVGAAANITIHGVGSFLSTGLIMIVQGISGRDGGHEWLGANINKARVESFYWVLAGMSVVNLCGYVCVARRFVYKRREVDQYNKF